MKPDERGLLCALAEASLLLANGGPRLFARDVINALPIHHKRAWYLLLKWTNKGWYNYGTSLDLGWLTAEGLRAAAEVKG